jgi:RNA polymerase sigma-70 factor, ECF subfamily
MSARDEQTRELLALVPRLRRLARVLTGNLADADDVAQASLEKAMRNLDQWQPGTNLDRWLFAIARNVWIDDRRRVHNRAQHDDIGEMIDLVGDDGVATLEQRSRDRAVRRAMDHLPEEQRVLIGLVVMEGYAYREAAEMLAMPIGTVMSRLSRAKAALAEHLIAEGVSS